MIKNVSFYELITSKTENRHETNNAIQLGFYKDYQQSLVQKNLMGYHHNIC